MQKKIVSLALSLALLVSMVYVGIVGLATTVSATEILETGLSEISLNGYKRITVNEIVTTASGYRVMNQDNDGDDNLWTVKGHVAAGYAGSFGGKTYLDVDMNFGGATGNGAYALSWQGNEKYRNSFYLYMYGGTNFVLAHYDASQAVSTLCEGTPAAHGVSNSGFFNVKLATDVQKASASATTETVTWHLWVNDIYVDGGKFSEDAHTRSVFTTGQEAGLLTMRVPKLLEDEFEGYEKVSLSDFKTGTGTGTDIPATPAGMAIDHNNKITFRAYNQTVVTANTAPEAANVYSLDKKYLDFDINQNGSTSDTSSIFLFERVHWYDDLVIYWNDANNLKIDYRKTNAQGTAVIDSTYTYDLRAFGRATNSEFFNLKIRSDFSANASDSSKRDAVIQIWINDRFADELNLTATDMRNGLAIRRQGSTNWYLRESKDMAAELEGYRRVDMFDFSKAVGTDGVVSFAANDLATSYVTDFDKTYLDVDLQYGNDNTGQFQYQGFDKYKACFYMSFPSDSQFRLGAYVNSAASGTPPTLVTVSTSDYGISKSNYFNVKLRTDIVNNGSTDAVTVQLWINNQFAYEGSVTFTYGESEHRKSQIRTIQAMNVRSAIDTDTQLKDYNRIVADDFDNIGASVAIGGTSYAAGVAGEYTGNASDFEKSYFDVDIKTPNNSNPFLVWLSKNKSNTGIYGDRSQLYFYLKNSTTLTLLARATSGDVDFTLGDISADPYFYSDSEFFNIKIKTTIYGANSIGVAVWINEHFLKNVYINKYDAETIAQMTCAGFRGDSANGIITYARTPLNGAKLLNLEYNLANGNYLLKGWPTFRVNGTTMSAGEVLSDPGDYTVEYMLDGEPVASRTISLYKLGDANLDGDAFVTGDSVYKDAYTTVGMIKYGAVTRASVLAADLNNDGVLNDADSSLFMAVKSDVSKVDSIVGSNYGDSIGFNYEGGKNTMPVGGYYGPATAADINDELFSALKDSGINMITYQPTKWGTGNDRDVLRVLALAEKYGIGVYITDPSTNDLTIDENDDVTAQTTVSTSTELANAMAQYGIYDSFIGLEVIGEPKPSTGGDLSANNYKRYKYYDDLLGTLQDYANVSGGYVIQGAGAFDPGEYGLLDEVEPDVDYLAFDSYLYLEQNSTIKGYKRNAYFESLDTFRQKSISSSKPFWSYVSAGCDFRDNGAEGATAYHLTEADLLWNVNTSLAFGAKGITYFPMIQPTYFAKVDVANNEYDYDRNGIIGADGEPNIYYDMVQRANNQIAAVDNVLMNADSKGVIAVGSAATDISTAASQRSYSFGSMLSRTGGKYTDKLSNVTATTGAMVGAFDYHSSEAYYVVNYDTTAEATQTINLTFGNSQDVTVIKDGVETTYNSVSSLALTLDSGEGALVILQDYNDVVIDVANGTFTLSEAGTVNGVARAAAYEITTCGVFTVVYAGGSTYNVVIYKVGDLTADNKVDIRDLVKLKRYYADSSNVTLDKAELNGLTNLTGSGTADKLTSLVNILLGR